MREVCDILAGVPGLQVERARIEAVLAHFPEADHRSAAQSVLSAAAADGDTTDAAWMLDEVLERADVQAAIRKGLAAPAGPAPLHEPCPLLPRPQDRPDLVTLTLELDRRLEPLGPTKYDLHVHGLEDGLLRVAAPPALRASLADELGPSLRRVAAELDGIRAVRLVACAESPRLDPARSCEVAS